MDEAFQVELPYKRPTKSKTIGLERQWLEHRNGVRFCGFMNFKI